MASAASVDIALGLSGMGEVLGGLSVVERAIGTVGRGAGGIIGAAGGVVAGIGTAVVTAGAAGAVALGGLSAAVGGVGVDFLAMREQALTAFTTLLGSGQQATAFIDQLQQLAAATPFEFPDLVTGAQRLMSMGIAATQVIPTLTAIGNAVAAMGGGKEQIDRVTLAIGQMQAKGRVQGDEMLQLAEAGIPAWKYLATALGTDIPTAMKMVTKGSVSAATGIAAITAGMQHDFGGAMAAQSTTWNGLTSSVKDYGKMMAGALMQPVFDRALKPALLWLTNYMAGPGQAAATRLGTMIAGGMDRAAGAFRTVMGVVADFRDVLNGGTGGGGLGGQLAVGFLLIKDTITNRVLPAVRLLWAQISGAAGGVNPLAIILGVAGAAETVGRWFQLGVDAVITFRQALAGVWTLNGGGNDFVNMVGRIGLAFRDLQGAFDAGGWSAFFGTLWTGYVQPALGNLWTGITTWITTNGPGILATLGGWASAFGTWAQNLWVGYIWPWMQVLWTDFTNWITTQGPGILQQLGTWAAAFGGWFQNLFSAYILPWLGVLWTQFDQWIGAQSPLIIAKLAEWGGAFINWAQTDGATIGQALWDAISGKTAAPLTPLALGTIGDLNGVVPQTTNSGIAGFLDTLNTSIQVWGATTGHQAFMDAMRAALTAGPTTTDVGDRVIAQGQVVFDNQNGPLVQWLNDQSAAIVNWWSTTGAQALLDGMNNAADWLGQALLTSSHWINMGDMIGRAIFSGLPKWAQDFLIGSGQAVATAPQYGTPGTGNDGLPPAPTPRIGGGGGQGFTAYGFQFGNQGGGGVNLTVNFNSPITATDVAQSIAGQIYDALAPLLGESGGGGATPAIPAGTVY